MSQLCETWSLDEIPQDRILKLSVLGNGLLIPTESDLFDVTYARCGDEAIERAIEEQVPRLMASLTPVAPDLARGQLILSFYDKVVSRKFFGMASSSEKHVWEQWHIKFVVNTQTRDAVRLESDVLARQRRQATLEQALTKCIMQIAAFATAKIEHIPPIDPAIDASMIYSFEITTRPVDASSGWLPRFIKGGPPML